MFAIKTMGVFLTRTAMRSCWTRRRALHVYSPGVAAGSVVWPAAAIEALLLLLQLLLLL